MTQETAIFCARCGHVMNHHANKLVYAFDSEAVSEVMEEYYQCPNCGASLERRGSMGAMA